MDSQLFQLVNERSDRQDRALDEIKDLIKAHTEKDEVYWKKIDIQEAQVSLIKRLLLGVGAGISTIVAALWAWWVK